MSKRTKNIVIIIATALAALLMLLGGIRLVSAYLDRQYVQLHDGCAPHALDHKIVIKNDVMTPSTVIGARCDTLTVTNLDDEQRMIAFGLHEQHVPYDGVTEQVLEKGQSFTVTLVQTGSFKVHDHEHDEVKATFQVK